MRMQWIAIAVLVAIVLYIILVFNRLVRLRNQTREGWSGIDVQLRRRTDLIPNLVDAVKGYAAHERGLFEQIATLRASSLAADNVSQQAAAERALKGALSRLLVLAENYPQLKANENFLKLQEQLSEIEDQLQMARRYYNGSARDLNVAIQSFPSVVIARLFGFHEAAFFELDDREAAQAPKISLSRGEP